MTRYECPRCHRKKPGINGMMCFNCRCNMNPKMYELFEPKERQLDLKGRKLSIFH